MKINKISFQNYRNLKDGTLEPIEGVNIICGNNAQGKTNLLESMWLFTGGKSFRGSKDSELTTFGEKFTQLETESYIQERTQKLKIEIKSGKRAVEINKVPQPHPSALVGKLCAVAFSPVHLSLIKDGPGLRRRFLDTAICQIKPMYTKHLLKYNHILNQRNVLLRTIKKSKNLIETLDIWEENLSICASEIISQRISYTEKLKNLSQQFYNGLSLEKETLKITYRSSINKEIVNEKEVIKKELKKKLEETREDDIALGFTTKGPHRDDLEVKIDGKSARMYASQGQQRSAVLAMKLAEAEIVDYTCKEAPIVLLDDVLSELDRGRQNYLLNSISNKQIFITCCEEELEKRFSSGKIFKVSNGEIIY